MVTVYLFLIVPTTLSVYISAQGDDWTCHRRPMGLAYPDYRRWREGAIDWHTAQQVLSQSKSLLLLTPPFTVVACSQVLRVESD